MTLDTSGVRIVCSSCNTTNRILYTGLDRATLEASGADAVVESIFELVPALESA